MYANYHVKLRYFAVIFVVISAGNYILGIYNGVSVLARIDNQGGRNY